MTFGGDPILESIFDFCERSEPDLLHPSEQPVIRRSNVRNGGCGKTSHLSVSKYFFTTLAT